MNRRLAERRKQGITRGPASSPDMEDWELIPATAKTGAPVGFQPTRKIKPKKPLVVGQTRYRKPAATSRAAIKLFQFPERFHHQLLGDVSWVRKPPFNRRCNSLEPRYSRLVSCLLLPNTGVHLISKRFENSLPHPAFRRKTTKRRSIIALDRSTLLDAAPRGTSAA